MKVTRLIKPLVSIIITTKNEQANIEALLKSIKIQSYKNFEIIVVDNNSTDKTKLIAKKYTKKVFNFGPERSAQRNFGVDKSEGIYVLILDADMVLDRKVLEDCVKQLEINSKAKALVIPEKSFGTSFWATVKGFEKSFYLGDSTIEAARFFDHKVFNQFKGYDLKITGPEDYELPYRISKKYSIDRIPSFIMHNEGNLSLWRTMKKKYYYASKASSYLKKHPEMLFKQGNLLFRPAFFKKWPLLLAHPFLSLSLFFMRAMEMSAAMLGFIKGRYL